MSTLLEPITCSNPIHTTSRPPSAPKDNENHPIETETNLSPSATQASLAPEFPEGGLQAWLVVAGAWCIMFSTYGLTNSAGIFQSYWEGHQLSSSSSSTIGWIPAVNVFLILILGVQVGPMFDKYGPRWLLWSGALGYVVSLVLIAQCTTYWQLMLAYGVFNGICGGALTTTAISVISHWFEKKRGFATGIALVGSSLGGTVFPLILKPMFDALGWAWSLRALALIVLVFQILGCLLIRGRLPTKMGGAIIDLKCFEDMRFVWATVGIACFEFVLFCAIGMFPTWILYQGFSSQTSFNAMAVLNAGSIFGRASAGYLSDHIGRFNTMLLTLVWTLIVTLALWLPVGQNIVLLYVAAPAFGFGGGCVISLTPVCIGQLCKASQYGRYFGTSYSVVSFATLICIPIGGALLPAAGAEGFVAFQGGILVLSILAFIMARWASLEYHWGWKVVI